MPLFDIIETSGRAYIKAWEERAYLLKLVLMPFLAKALFFAIVLIMGYEDNVFRQTLVMLPAYFLEGWMIAHIARLIVLGERWPVRLSGKTEQDILYLAARGRAIFAAILLYTLIKMGQNAVMAPIVKHEEEFAHIAEENEPSLMIFLLAFGMIAFMVWFFKFMFLHLAIAVDIPIRSYLQKLPGIQSSLYLLGAWLTCYIPFLLAGIIILKLVSVLLMNYSDFFLLVIFVVHFAVDLIAMCVVTICFSMALKHIFSQQNNSRG